MHTTNDLKNTTERAFSDTDTVQVLALDGGGLKGLFTASVLRSLEDQLGHSILDHFDIVTGTSTGGLIAIALGRGKSAKDVQEFYVEEGENIFPAKGISGLLRSCRSWFFSKYSNRTLKKVLVDLLEDDEGKQPLLADSIVRLVIPTFLAGNSVPRLLKTPHASRYKYDWRLPMRAVGMATSAAPTYLPVFEHDGRSYIDGGVWANNPSLIGVIEAMDLGANISNVRVLNIGTTFSDAPSAYLSILKGLVHFRRSGRLSWALQILPTIMQANSYATTGMFVHQLLKAGNSYSINPQVDQGRFSLDEVNLKELTELGASAGEQNFPRLQSFLSHNRHPYSPSSDAMKSDPA